MQVRAELADAGSGIRERGVPNGGRCALLESAIRAREDRLERRCLQPAEHRFEIPFRVELIEQRLLQIRACNSYKFTIHYKSH